MLMPDTMHECQCGAVVPVRGAACPAGEVATGAFGEVDVQPAMASAAAHDSASAVRAAFGRANALETRWGNGMTAILPHPAVCADPVRARPGRFPG
jgi:hypothetical protein